MPKILLFC
jgi:hypothetical protein